MTSAKRPLSRRILRAVLATLGVLVLLALLFVGWLHSSSGQGYVRARVERALKQAFVGEVRLGDLGFSLFGDVRVGKLSIKDAAGVEAIGVDEVHVAPAWRSLLGDAPTIELVKVKGVRVHVVQNADGTTNLDHLAREQPAPTGPEKPSKSSKQVRLAAFEIDDVKVTVDRADGSRATADLVHTNGSIALAPAKNAVDLEVPSLRAEVALDFPNGGGGVAIRKFETAARAHLVDRAGDVKLGPTKASIEIAPPGKPPRGFELDLAPIEAHLAKGDLRASFDKLLLGALSLQGFEVHTHTEGEALNGEQSAGLAVHVDAKKFDALLDKQVLASDVDVDARLSGPPDHVVLHSTIKSGGAEIEIDGDLDVATDRTRPGYTIKVEGKGIDTAKILGPDVAAPPITVDAVTIEAHGRGTKPEDLDADVKVRIDGVTANGAKVDAIAIDGHAAKGEITVSDASVRALGQGVHATATYRLADRHVHAEVTPTVRGADAIAPLKKLGIQPNGPLGSIAIKEGDAKITVDGQAGGALHANVDARRVAIGGGRVDVQADADLVFDGAAGGPKPRALTGTSPPPPASERKVAIDHARATVRFEGVDAATLAGKPLPVAATASGRVTFEGTEADPVVDADVRVVARARGEGHANAAVVAIKADVKDGRVHAHVRAADEHAAAGAPALATAEIAAALAEGKLAPNAPIDVRVDVPRRKLAELASLTPRDEDSPKVPEGEIEVHAKIGGTAQRPAGTFDVDVTGVFLDKTATQHLRAHGDVRASKRLGGPAIDVDAEAWLRDGSGEAPIKIHADADTGGATPGAPVVWALAVDVPERAIEQIPLPRDKKESLAGLTGKVKARVDVHGTRDDLDGKIRVDADDLERDGRGPLSAHTEITIDKDATRIDLRALARDTTFLTIGGKVGVAGRGLLARTRENKEVDPDLDLALAVPDSEIKKLAPLAPRLADLPGHVHGAGTVKGKPSAPVVKLGLAADQYATLDGRTGHAALDLGGDRHGAHAKVEVDPESGDGVSLEAELPIPEKISITDLPEARAKARADAVDLRTIVPAVVLDGKPIDVSGKLDWEMDATASVKPTLRGVGLKAKVVGDLAIKKGKIALVGTSRVFDGVELKVESDAKDLRIEKLHLHESDAEKKDRTIDVSGDLAWEDLSPEHADLRIKTKDWLLFGGEKLGKPDAPRGALTADVKVAGDLDGPIKSLDADVEALELRIPDRFDRSHQPEVVSLGDVIEVKGGVAKGKLPQPPKPDAAPAEKKAQVDESKGWDIHVRIKKPIHLEQAPLDLMTEGGVDVAVRSGERRVRGKLKMVSGSVMVGGKKHLLTDGAVTWDEAHPEGFIDLHFARPLAPETQRDMSIASSTGAVRVDMVGPLGKQKVSLRGAGNVVLFETLSVDSAGRERFYTAPGLPAGETIQLPRHDDVLTLTFLSVNMPHLLFLDRVSGYADPYEDRASYGQLNHYEGTRTSDDGKVRVKAVSQPPRVGESSNAVELDWMWWNSGRGAAGVGIQGGDREGGGPGVFFEWNSRD